MANVQYMRIHWSPTLPNLVLVDALDQRSQPHLCHSLLCEENVWTLDVHVHDAALVQVVQALRHVQGDLVAPERVGMTLVRAWGYNCAGYAWQRTMGWACRLRNAYGGNNLAFTRKAKDELSTLASAPAHCVIYHVTQAK